MATKPSTKPKNATKPKGTILKGLDKEVKTIDGELIWRPRENLMGAAILQRDKQGTPIADQIIEQEPLTRRKAINLALANDPKDEAEDGDAKLRAGYLQRLFWKDKEIKLDADDIVFIKNRLNHKFIGPIYFVVCEYLEGVTE